MNNKLSKASIFKANDIRGIYGRELKNYDAKKIGSVFAEFTKSNEIIVGRDNRISSPALYKSIVRGITDVGSSVIDIGVIDSPGTYFASHLMKKPCIMITASHNPAQHNGFYLCKKDGESIFIHNGLKEIEKNFAKGKIRYSRQKGKVIKKNIWNDYIKHIMSFINKSKIKDMKIVIDPGNGVGAIIAEKIYNQIPQIKVSKINFYQDGRFPNRSPDTSVPKNLKDLCDAVKKEFADFGFAFDGDADRIAFVNEKGIVIEGSIIGALLIDNIFKENIKNEKIIYSIGCSKIVEEIIKKRGAKPIREKVGHSFINASMRKYNALFGVEHTGHYFYRENFFTESAIITSLIMSEIYSKSGKKISEMIKPYEKYYMTREISFPTKNQIFSLKKIEKELIKEYKKKIDKFDGLFLNLGSYWFRVRASQTEPLIRLTIEGESKRIVERERKKLIKIIRKNL